MDAARTLAQLRVQLDDFLLDSPGVGELLQQLSWLQGQLKKRRRRDTPPPTRLCYICKSPLPARANICPDCASRNDLKRQQTADCRGRRALLTGGRVKIGYHVALKLLRAGAEVIATTRFPGDAARRYAAEPDAAEWASRLHLLPLDLRCVSAVEQFVATCVSRWPHLDFFIHNAAQTVRRPPAFYRHLLAAEREPLPVAAQPLLSCVPPTAPGLADFDGSMAWSAWLSQAALLPGDDKDDPTLFPPGEVDEDGQQIDRRPRNSWHWLLGEVPTLELLEVFAVNAVAPFVLLRELLPLFQAGPARDRFAVMVSSAEGRFNIDKPTRHPHTNMAKAALNMLVRTTAKELVRERVYLTAVDPGWVSVEFAEPVATALQSNGATPPLDAVDAAARVLDPIFSACNGAPPTSGVLLKDYQRVDW